MTANQMQVLTRLGEMHGCARRAHLVRSAADRSRLRALVESGEVLRVRRGLYALPRAAPAILAARTVGGLITCVTVARRWELPLLAQDDPVHLSVPGHRGAPGPGLLPRRAVVHWESAQDAPWDARDAMMPLDLALVHAMRCLPFREAVALLDAAVGRGLVDHGRLLSRRPHSGKLGFDRVLRAVDPRSQSLPETFLRLALRARGVRVDPQAHLLGVGRVDLLVEGLVVVEVDGFAYHSGREQYREDRRRDRSVHLLGLPVLRFTFEDVVRSLDRSAFEVVTMVDHARRSGVHPPSEHLIARSAWPV